MRRKKVHIVVDVNSGVRRGVAAVTSDRAFFPRARALALILVFALSLFSLGAFQGRANTVLLHPSVCLGGWERASYAEGSPEYGAGMAISEETAAFLDAPIAGTIICGKFTGAIPDNTVPQRVTVRLFLAPHAGKPQEVSPDTPLVIPVVDEDLSSDDGLDGGSATIPEEEVLDADVLQGDLIEETSETTEPRQDEVLFEVLPSTIPPQTPDATVEVPAGDTSNERQPLSWIRYLVGVAHAAEIDEEVGLEPTLDVQEQVADPVLEVGAIVPLELFEEPDSQEVIEPAVPPGEYLPEETILEPAVLGVSTEPFLEVGMSINGEFQDTVATLTAAELDVVEFELSLPGSFSWEDFEFLEISLTKIPGLAAHQAVLLDGMEVVVEPQFESVSAGVFSGESPTELPEDPESESVPSEDDAYAAPEDGVPFEESSNELVHDSVIQQSVFKPRLFVEKRKYAPHAPFSCVIEPFRLEVGAEDTPLVVRVEGNEFNPVLLEVGSVPAGLELTFGAAGAYEQLLNVGESSATLSLSILDDDVMGDFTIPIIATAQNASNWSVICQLNVAL